MTEYVVSLCIPAKGVVAYVGSQVDFTSVPGVVVLTGPIDTWYGDDRDTLSGVDRVYVPLNNVASIEQL